MGNNTNLILENQLCFPIYATSRLITKLYRPFLLEIGLTYPQYLVMLVLWENDNQKVSNIGEKLLLNTNTITPLLKTMVKKGLIEKIKAPYDERVILIKLSKRGSQLKVKASEIPTKMADTSSIPINELEQMKSSMWKMLKYLQ
ncbi:MAG: MarR family winged helix-turn-helix transcriptional regulator [Salibacteraceae bacterium]